MLGERIKAARKAAGLSLRALSQEVGVSPQTLSLYERSLSTPNGTMLLRLARALGVKVDFFFRPSQLTLARPAYRKRSTLPRKQEDAIMGQIQDWLERYREVEALFPNGATRPFSVPENVERHASSAEDIEHLTQELRENWELGLAPIEDLTALLEDQGVRIGLVDGHDKFDAYTFTLDDRVPIIVAKRGLPGDRQRMSIAHELGHFIMEMDDEEAAFRFAKAFLVPEQVARFELGTDRRTLDLCELHILKHKYGLSMQGWIYRARELGILSGSAAKELFQQFRARGWHREEPGDPYPPELPMRMMRLVHRALAEDLISESRAAELLSTSLRVLSITDAQQPGKPLAPFSMEEQAPCRLLSHHVSSIVAL
jgi:transcriptional regulator with XRE-family HTH domain